MQSLRVNSSSLSVIYLPIVIAIAGGLFFFVSQHRLIDGDEGYYLMASKLVTEQHRFPYLDFFYTQAPLLPYAYGLWLSLAGETWFSARLFAAVLTWLTCLLVSLHVYRETRSVTASVTAIILFTSCTLVFAWFPIAKTYSLTALVMFSAFTIITLKGTMDRPLLLIISGLMLGIGVSTRLYISGLLPVFIFWIYTRSVTSSKYVNNIWLLVGFVIGILPCITLFIASPDVFMFNNLGFHLIRSDYGFLSGLSQKLSILYEVLLKRQDNGIQLTALFAISIFTLWIKKKGTASVHLALWIAVLAGAISLLPTPTFPQYFSICAPFLIVSAVCGTTDYVRSLDTRFRTRTAAIALAVAAAVFIVSAAPSFRRYLYHGGIIGTWDPADHVNWTLASATQVSAEIDRMTAPGEQVVSFWPGYVFPTHATPFPHFENDFGWMVADKLPPDRRAKYKIESRTEIGKLFAAHETKLVVVGNQTNGGYGPAGDYTGLLAEDGYSEAKKIYGTSVFMYSPTNGQKEGGGLATGSQTDTKAR